MTIRQSVFGSKIEQGHFWRLEKTWGNKFRIYHNLPFLNIFDCDNLIDVNDQPYKTFTLSKEDINCLKKTSVDFTLCDTRGVPKICIEFDGLKEGFNVGTHYHQKEPKNRWREKIMGLKLKVAHGSLLPFFIFGPDQFKHLTTDTHLTIADGIIGDIVSSQARQQRFAKFETRELGYTQDEFDNLDHSTQQALIEDWALGTEVDCDHRNNPIVSKKTEIAHKLGWPSVTFISPTNQSNAASPKMFEGFIVKVNHSKLGVSTKQVILPNYETGGVLLAHITLEIAHLMALEELRLRQN